MAICPGGDELMYLIARPQLLTPLPFSFPQPLSLSLSLIFTSPRLLTLYFLNFSLSQIFTIFLSMIFTPSISHCLIRSLFLISSPFSLSLPFLQLNLCPSLSFSVSFFYALSRILSLSRCHSLTPNPLTLSSSHLCPPLPPFPPSISDSFNLPILSLYITLLFSTLHLSLTPY